MEISEPTVIKTTKIDCLEIFKIQDLHKDIPFSDWNILIQ